jgi:sporulation protein YlmC with PRC-barrel domain
MLEDLHIGVPVTGRDGRHLGALKQIVVDSASTQVTHVVVDPGLVESGNFLAPGGWERPRSRIVPVTLIASADDKGVRLSCDEAQFKQLPLFESDRYVEIEPSSGQPARFRMGELVRYLASAFGLGGAPYISPDTAISLNEAPGSAAIAEGTPVWRREPHEEVGEIERVLVDEQTQRVRAFVMRRKGRGSKRVELPVAQVHDVENGIVHITLSDRDLDALRPYEGDRE